MRDKATIKRELGHDDKKTLELFFLYYCEICMLFYSELQPEKNGVYVCTYFVKKKQGTYVAPRPN